jgi:hypothetical protein
MLLDRSIKVGAVEMFKKGFKVMATIGGVVTGTGM